ncbi:MAG: fructoselysine 6-kinase, partial [Ruthenibacterium sp.]
MKIAAVGDNCIDYYLATGESYPGGNSVNVSVYITRLGQQSSYTGAVGNDANGKLLCTALKNKGVDISHIHVKEGTTAITEVELVEGDRVFASYNAGVMKHFQLTHQDIDFLCEHDLIVTAQWGMVENELEQLKKRGKLIAFDFADKFSGKVLDTAIPYTDYAFFSCDEGDSEILRQFMQKMHARGVKIVTVTLGKKGSIAYDGTSFQIGEIVPCAVKDTMGAGDSFIAGFLVALLKGHAL